MVIMYLLADLEPVFNKHYPRKLDVNKGLTIEVFSLLSNSPTKWSNILKHFVGCCKTIRLRVFDHFFFRGGGGGLVKAS